MHNYYRAIGFKRVRNTKNILRKTIKKAVKEYKDKSYDTSLGNLVEIFVPFGKYIGMIIHGEFLETGDFEVEYTFPFVRANQYTFYDNISVELNSFNFSFSAVCDNSTNGNTIIFYLQNALDYINMKIPSRLSANVGLSALCMSGKIILPSQVNSNHVKENELIKEKRNKMIEDAKNGDEEAIENLTFDEMDLYSKISKRILHEDVLTIVESSFMPSGIECDIYSIIGNIIGIEESYNNLARAELYYLTLECNDTVINVIIDKADLLGEPLIGRRFKGKIWLQGNVRFKDT